MRKKIGKNEVVTFKCPTALAVHLKSIAMSYTRQSGKLYTLSDLIRDTLRQIFPEPKQLDFTEDSNVVQNKRTAPPSKDESYGEKPLP